MIKILTAALMISIGTVVSIYSFNVPSIDDNTMIKFNDHRGKKILLVNTATGSGQAYQLAQLQELYMQHRDSLVVIAFPSNSFGHEPRSGDALKHYMRDSLALTFPIARLSDINGPWGNMVFGWLASKSQNTIANAKTGTDMQKFLIDKNGVLMGIFDSSASPIGTLMQEAVRSGR